MTKERVLIAVKTYPTLSNKYTELVCTAGFREDGSWVRIYPFPFRLLRDDQKYKKYQWVELELQKNKNDKRPESYNPSNIDDVTLGGFVSTARNWADRKDLILDNNKIYTNLNEIIQGAHANELSLVIFKPSQIIDFKYQPVESEWKVDKKMAAEEALKQGALFEEDVQKELKLMPKLPFKFSYKFKDDAGKESTLMIEDWEIGQLYWNCHRKYGEAKALEKVREKYMDDFAKTKDLHLFLGTTHQFHMKKAPNPFVIIGVFPPPVENQYSLL